VLYKINPFSILPVKKDRSISKLAGHRAGFLKSQIIITAEVRMLKKNITKNILLLLYNLNYSISPDLAGRQEWSVLARSALMIHTIRFHPRNVVAISRNPVFLL
jgi:hypothetical protein